MEIHYPIQVKAFPNYLLSIVFNTGEEKIFDMKPYFDDPFFAPLQDENVFVTVRTTPISIEWDGDIDIAPEELYENSVAV